jgi:hypothetical protein
MNQIISPTQPGGQLSSSARFNMAPPTHVLASDPDELQEKGHDTVELDHIKQPVDQPNLETESRFAGLGRLAAARVFWKSIIWAFLASVGALFDGYAIVSK